MKSLWIKSIFLLTALFITSCSEINKNFYADLKNLSENQKQWIPEFLLEPEVITEVHDIYENHDLDTNTVWGKFTLQNSNLLKFSQDDKDFNNFNKKEIDKKLTSLKFAAKDCEQYFLTTTDFNYILFKEIKTNKFFYFGKYK